MLAEFDACEQAIETNCHRICPSDKQGLELVEIQRNQPQKKENCQKKKTVQLTGSYSRVGPPKNCQASESYCQWSVVEDTRGSVKSDRELYLHRICGQPFYANAI
jgi:hypothetical protein